MIPQEVQKSANWALAYGGLLSGAKDFWDSMLSEHPLKDNLEGVALARCKLLDQDHL